MPVDQSLDIFDLYEQLDCSLLVFVNVGLGERDRPDELRRGTG
jgi:hypothetical protein